MTGRETGLTLGCLSVYKHFWVSCHHTSLRTGLICKHSLGDETQTATNSGYGLVSAVEVGTQQQMRLSKVMQWSLTRDKTFFFQNEICES